MPATRDTDETREAGRILERVARQADAGGAPAERTPSDRGRSEAADPMEVLGTRIGRALGIALTIGLVIWLLRFAVTHG